jgi:hypothetical protein
MRQRHFLSRHSFTHAHLLSRTFTHAHLLSRTFTHAQYLSRISVIEFNIHLLIPDDTPHLYLF